MQYIWTAIGIESSKRNNVYETFNNPNEGDILTNAHLEIWSKVIHDKTLTFEKLETYQLAERKQVVSIKKVKKNKKKN